MTLPVCRCPRFISAPCYGWAMCGTCGLPPFYTSQRLASSDADGTGLMAGSSHSLDARLHGAASDGREPASAAGSGHFAASP